MEPNIAAKGPVNFFMGGGRYISDNFNMQIIDTANPNAFENLTLNSVMPDMMESYIQSEKAPQAAQAQADASENNGGGFFNALKNFFSAPAET